jgi:hypothetical protein
VDIRRFPREEQRGIDEDIARLGGAPLPAPPPAPPPGGKS